MRLRPPGQKKDIFLTYFSFECFNTQTIKLLFSKDKYIEKFQHVDFRFFFYKFSTKKPNKLSAQVTQDEYCFSTKVQCVSFSGKNPEFFIYSFITNKQICFCTKTTDFVIYSFSTKLRYLRWDLPLLVYKTSQNLSFPKKAKLGAFFLKSVFQTNSPPSCSEEIFRYQVWGTIKPKRRPKPKIRG